MPIYDYICEKCKKEETQICRIADRVIPDCCDQKMEPIIHAAKLVGPKIKGNYGQHTSRREWRRRVSEAKRKTARGDKA